MVNQVSPGVNITEVDLTASVPTFSTTQGAVAGVFAWGPINDPVLIDSETTLVDVFGKPNEDNFETFFSASSFLAYANALYVVRAASDTAYNAVGLVSPDANQASIRIDNAESFERNPNPDQNIAFAARYAGDLGNSLAVHVCENAEQYASKVELTSTNIDGTKTGLTISAGESRGQILAVADDGIVSSNELSDIIDGWLATVEVGDTFVVSNDVGTQQLTIKSISDTDVFGTDIDTGFVTVSREITFGETYRLVDDYIANIISRRWKYANIFDKAPNTSPYVAERDGSGDEIHVAVEDVTGEITGLPNTVIERWDGLSRATDSRTPEGSVNYYQAAINSQSKYILAVNHPQPSYVGKAASLQGPVVGPSPRVFTLAGGSDGDDENTIPVSKLAKAYDIFNDVGRYDVSLIIQGKARGGQYGQVLAIHLLDNLCARRKDCVAFVTPTRSTALSFNWLDESVDWRNSLPSTSFGFAATPYRYEYDKYNDVFRWVPSNGAIAGITALSDRTNDPWVSPAGFTRGQFRSTVKLSHSPTKAEQDVLYRNGINPVISFPGRGHILYGDKTLLAVRSAFDRINVRRLFITLQKSLGRFAQDNTLFELNTPQTRNAFRSAANPYLRDIQGRSGIIDFRVVADTTNNTPEVQDRQEFRANIFIKPSRSINFIELQFTAVRTGVEFTEITGA